MSNTDAEACGNCPHSNLHHRSINGVHGRCDFGLCPCTEYRSLAPPAASTASDGEASETIEQVVEHAKGESTR